jgi:hypothetical protein
VTSGLWRFLGLGLFIAVAVPSLRAQTDVTGTWDLTVQTRQGTATPSVTLQQSGEKLSGTYHGRMGDTKVEGTVRGNDIRFAVTLRFQDQAFVVTYTGTVDKDSMKGTVQFGDRGSGTWSGKRRSG